MKKITFCFVMLLMVVFGSFAQVQVGDGTAIDKGVPFEPSTSYSYAQSIYLSSEILATGTITALQYYYAGPYDLTGSQDLTVYIGHTTKTTFTSTSDWEPLANLTEVYSGGLVANGAGWVSFELETPFLYNGTDNLIIAVKENSEEAGYGEDDFYAYQVVENRSLSFSSWSPLDLENQEDGELLDFVPIITFEGINQACPKPMNLVASDPTTTGISLYWNSSVENATGSQYYIATSNTAPSASTEPTGNVTSGEYALVETGLLPGTEYYVWVRDLCEGNPGVWSNSASFVTACIPTNLFFENFDSTPINTLPICWSAIIDGTEGLITSSVKITNEDANSGGKSVEFYRNSDETSRMILVTPILSNLQEGTNRLKFFAKRFIMGNAASLKIGTLDSNMPEANFTVVDQIELTENFIEYTVDFTSLGETSDSYVGIMVNTLDPNFLGYVDDIRWEVTPLCPDVTQITVPVATIATAIVQWQAGDNETQWEVVHATTATTDPSTLTPVVSATATPSAEINDLQENTNYFVWVRSVCGAGNGLWMGPVAFKTPCAPVNSIIENFDGVAAPALPNCWTKILRGETLSSYASVKTILDGANSAPNTVELYSGFSAPGVNDDVILVSPNLGNLSAGTHRLKFYAYGIGTLQIVTLNSNTISATYNSFQNVSIVNGPMTEYVVDFATYTGSDSFIGIRFLNALAFDTILIDDIIWETSPSCPDVSQISFPEIYTNSIAVNWVSPDATQWQVVYGSPSVIDPNALTPSEILTSPAFEMEELTDNTTYKVWIRSLCGETDGNGAWSSPLLVTTACAIQNVFNETFEGTTIPTLPSCWSSITSSTATVSTISWQPFAGTRSLEMYNAGAMLDTDIILISPKLNNLSAGTHRVRFFSRNFGGGSLEVGTINQAAVYTSLTEVDLTDTYQEYTVQFNTYEGEDTQIGFRMVPTDNYQTVNLDNIVWEIDPELSNGDFDNSNFTFYPNPVKEVLNLSYKQNITTVLVYNLLGQKILENTINANQTQVNMSDLASGSYIVKVLSENQTKTIKVIKE